MMRFHNGSTSAIDIFSNDKLIIANILPLQTSLYIKICSGDLKGVSVLTGQQVFTAKIKIKSDNMYTVFLTSSTVRVYKDIYKKPKNGTSLVRNINTSNTFQEQSLGSLTVNEVTFDAINQGVYTVFPSVSVLYNHPKEMKQDLCFEDYIGRWKVVAQLGVTGEQAYIFSQTTEGEWELPITMNTNANTNGMTVPFSWIVHTTDYKEYSLNGSANRQRLVILTRCKMSKEKYRELVYLADKLGYNTSNLTKN